MDKMPSNIENLEKEAEQTLEDARVKAAEIIATANKESQNVLSSSLDVKNVEVECKNIIENAQHDSEEKIERSKQQAENLKITASQKVDAIADRLTKMITEA